MLARWSPGGNDKWQIDLNILGVPGVFSKVIQIDNTDPLAILNLDNNGDCTYFHLGDTITGNFTATDDYISSYSLSTSFTGTAAVPIPSPLQSGNADAINEFFSFTTDANGTPCGSVELVVYEKTIHDSVTTGYHGTGYKQEIVAYSLKLKSLSLYYYLFSLKVLAGLYEFANTFT